MSSCRFAAVTAIMLMLLVPGCGRKSAFVPPQKLVPVKINDLHYVLDENGVTLKWSYPATMENGDSIQAIESFEIYRAAIPAEEFCQGCPVRYKEPVEIGGGRLPPAGGGRSALYKEGYLQNGYRYLYKVRSRVGWWYPSADSNVVSFIWNVPPKAPQGLRTEAGDRSLVLRWDPVTENSKGAPLEHPVLYQVYRRSGSEEFSALGDPVPEPEFIDAGLINAADYSYMVRALAAEADTLRPGGASQVVSGVPRDLTPPEPPQQLVAVVVPAGVQLVWQAVAGDDLAGYRIYRRQEGSAVPELIAEVGPDRNQYIDQTVTRDGKLFYSVTAFDTAQPVNESSPAPAVDVDLR